LERLENRLLLAADWQNPARPTDVNNDMAVSPLDALLVINELNREGSRDLGVRPHQLARYLDTNGDGSVSAIDALRVINQLNRSDNLSPVRTEGESESAPAGFISDVFATLPGNSSEILELSSQVNIVREEFNELGLFIMDGPEGEVNGVSPSSSLYPEEVFAQAERRVLYSRQGITSDTNHVIMPAGSWVGVYVLQETSGNGNPEDHIRVQQQGTFRHRIGWEEHVTNSPWDGIGDRGYDDVLVDIQLGTPFDPVVEPEFAPIPDQTIDEQQTLVVQATAIDPDSPDAILTYSLIDGPPAAAIDPATGRLTWDTTEQDGPGDYDVTVQVESPDGQTDQTSFGIVVNEVNRAPVLDAIGDQAMEVGQELAFTASATDADQPANTLTYSLDAGAPAGATIDSSTGEFTWTPPATARDMEFSITVRVTDNGTPALDDFETINVTVGECPFPDLDNWTVTESGGTTGNAGAVTTEDCETVLTEGDSFVVSMATSFEVPADATTISFTYSDLNFDTTDDDFINDAFEAALVDSEGNSLVNTYTDDRDAFFNISEDVGAATGSGVTIDGTTVTVDTSGILAGETATLIFRLANNDSDTATSVRIAGFDLPGTVAPTSATTQANAPQTSGLLGSAQTFATAVASQTSGRKTATATNDSLALTAELPVSTSTIGSQILLTGKANTDTSGGRIAHVTVDGAAVAALDAAGNFFSNLVIEPGVNTYTVTATDPLGESVSVELSMTGRTEGSEVDFSRFADITGSFSGVYGRTSFQEETRQLFVDLATRNDGAFESDVPLLVGVRNISDPSVQLASPDGIMPDGTLYFDFSNAVDDGGLDPGEVSDSPTISFHNPLRQQFDYELVFLGKLNEAPIITSIPNLESFLGREYSYDVDATDADDDVLTHALATSPSAMTIDATNGEITWAPSVSDIGSHPVQVQVDDGRGGIATQRFTLVVREAPANRPPVITSMPVTNAYIGYDIAAELTEIVDLSTWSVHQYEMNSQPNANWVLSQDDTVATQTVNADASILLSDFDLANDRIEGTWLKSGWDDDLMGFVFGYQDDQHFYLFDWKQGTQGDSWGTAEVGMSVKRIDSDRPLVGADLWPTRTIDDSVELLFHNSIPYTTEQEYGFSLDFNGGHFKIIVTDGDTVLEEIEIEDGRYSGGKFGFYNNSQGDVQYRGFSRTRLASPSYGYDVEAIDPDQDDLSYALRQAPDGMRITDSAGVITWAPTTDQIGNHSVTVEVSDGRGGSAIQEFVVCVHGDPDNNPPTIISEPVTSYGLAGTSNPASGNVNPSSITLNLGANQDTSQQSVSLTLSPGDIALGTSDMIFVVDESRSMAGEQAWLGDVISTLDASLETVGLEGNRYGLVGFADTGRTRTAGGDIWMDAADFARASDTLSTGRSGREDGYRGIEYALSRYEFRENAVRTIVLVTDEDRTTVDSSATYQTVADVLTDADANLQIVANARFQDVNMDAAFGVAADGTTYVSDGSDGYVETTGGSYTGGKRDTEEDYVFLTHDLGGIAWDLNFLRQDQAAANTFTNVFVDIVGENIIRQIPIDVVASSSEATFTNLSGIQSDIGAYETATFEVEFGTQTPARFDLAFVNANTNEVLGSIPVNIGDIYQYQVQAVDPDDDNLTFSIVDGPDGLTIGSESGLVTWNFPLDANTTWPVTVRVADSRGGADEQTFDLRINQAGSGEIHGEIYQDTNGDGTQDPDESSLSDWTVYLDQNENGVRDPGERSAITDEEGEYRFTGLSEDTYFVRQVPQHGWQQTFPSLDVEVGGDGYAVHLSEDEVVSGLDFANKEVTVDAGNNPPSFDTTGATSATAFEAYRYDASATDPGNDPLTYSLRLAPDGMTVHPTLGTVVWIPQEAQVGSHNVVLEVSDGRGGSDVQAFEVAVSLPNTPPVFTSNPSDRAVAGTDWRYDLRVLEADGDPLAYELTDAPDGMMIESTEVRNSNGDLIETIPSIAWSVPAATANSTVTFSVQVDDGRGGVATQMVTLEVLDATTANQAPMFDDSPRPVARIGRLWTWMAHATDPEAQPITYLLTNGPAEMTLRDDGLMSWNVPADAPNSVAVEVVADDGHGGQTTLMFDLAIVTHDQNQPPAIMSVPPNRGIAGENYAYDPVAIDADGDSLLWSLTNGPRGMSIDTRTGAVRWTPDGRQLGTHVVAITVTDPFLGSFTQRFDLHVGCNNVAPAIVSVPPTVALTKRTYIYAVRADDLENDPLSWSLTGAPDGMTIDATSGLIRWNPAVEQIGSHDVSIEASDGLNVGRQDFSVVVSSADDPVDPSDPEGPTRGNRAPIITSTPLFSGQADSVYQYQVRAVDPDGDAVTFGLDGEVPTGMTIDDEGLIVWTPTEADAGQYLLSVQATDEHGAVSTQGYLLSITVNAAPEITSQPVTEATSGSTYRYSVRATDADGDTLSFQLDQAPDGMTIDRFGRILWQTSTDDTQSQDVTVTVSDGRGGTDSQSWQITVVADITPPNLTVTTFNNQASYRGDAQFDIGSVYTVQLVATDDVGIESLELLVDGSPVTLTDGAIQLTGDIVGTVQLTATAADTSGLTATVNSTVTIGDPGSTNPPTPTDPGLPDHPGFDPDDNGTPIVTISSPEPASTVTNRVSIIGTVDDPEDNLWYYRVYVARADQVSLTNLDRNDPDWMVINEGTEEVIEGELAVFDPSALTNDPYAVLVAAFDGNGQGYVQPTMYYVEGNVQVGNFRLDFTDLSIPLAGIPISVSRTYDTVNAGDEGDFGFGWSLGVQDARIFEAAAIGPEGALNGGNDKFVPDKTKVYLTSPSGQRIGFTYKERLHSASFFGGVFTPYFEPDPGVYETLTIDETQVARGGIVGTLAQGINPSNYTLTTKDGLKYRYNETGGLQTITDLNGNVVTFTEAGITHSEGQSIQFVRDHRDRITEIIDPAGNSVTYEYNVAGDLVSFTNQSGLTTRYEYLDDPDHYLDQALDSLDRRVLKAVYEENSETGQTEFKGVIDADGNRIDNRDFDTDNNTGTVLDANGNATTLIYDDRGNVLTETDPDGNVTTREYNDPANPDLETRIIDRNGNVTDREYDARGNLMTITERGSDTNPLADPVVTAFTYDSGNRVSSITNATGATTAFVYDARGNLTRITNSEGNSSSFTHDSEGRRASFTDFNGNTTTFEYASADQPSKVTFVDGTYQEFAYNHFGQVTREAFHEADGTLVELRETLYDSSGRVLEEKSGLPGDPDHPQTIVRKVYDGHLLDWEIIVNPASPNETPDTPVSERLSRITDFDYDNSDRLIRQTDAEGGVVEFRYDAQGNRIALMDPVGNITTWFYDSLNRVIEERDPLYWDDVQATDAVFASMTDSDFLNRIAPVTPGSLADPLYDDPSGADASTNTGADHVRVTAYDAEGNQSKAIDRNGRRREYAYDHADRLLAETWYAAATGELVETITFTYDTLGNMLTATDSNSNYLFTYDTLNRLESVDNNPDGTREVPRVILTYAYDAQGNVISTSDDAGVTGGSTYNARNQLATRTWFDADGSGDVDDARVDFFYNAAGRESEIRRYSDLDANALVGRTIRTYDAAGRSNLLTHVGAVDELLAGYDYDYDFAGLLLHEARTHQDSQFAQTIDYVYDLTGQLSFADFDTQDDETYVYDANGNRITSQVGTDQRTYTTGGANQLESDGTYRYEYDREGNQVKRIELTTSETRSFIYDHHNRLVRVDDWSSDPGDPQNPAVGAILTQTVKYIYGALGRRIARSVDADGEGSQSSEKEFFVYNGDNVWADFDEAEVAIARYLFEGHIDQNLARQRSDEGIVWYLVDKLDSVRNVVSANGTLIDSINFQTFGEIVGSEGAGHLDRFAFTARELDLHIGNYYYRARTYDASIGRFVMNDPLGIRAGDFNYYRYVYNSPTSGTDPTGQLSAVEVGALTGFSTFASRALIGKFIRGESTSEAVEEGFKAGVVFGLVTGFGAAGLALRAGVALAELPVIVPVAVGVSAGATGEYQEIILDAINDEDELRPYLDLWGRHFVDEIYRKLGIRR
jgi:RHS repeat-associated protein